MYLLINNTKAHFEMRPDVQNHEHLEEAKLILFRFHSTHENHLTMATSKHRSSL